MVPAPVTFLWAIQRTLIGDFTDRRPQDKIRFCGKNLATGSKTIVTFKQLQPKRASSLNGC